MNLPDPNLTIEDHPDLLVLAMLVWGEARGEPDQGKLAVAEVVKNRSVRPAWWNRCGPKRKAGAEIVPEWGPIKRTALKPWQFSCFNANDPNRDRLLQPTKHDSHDVWEACFRVADFIYHIPKGQWTPTAGVARGADYYHTLAARGRWITLAKASGLPLAKIGGHLFWELGPDGVPDTPDDLVGAAG